MENHINLIENKISKSLGILHRAKFLLNQKSIFFNKFSMINHNYPKSSKNSGNYKILKSTLKLTNFAISRTGPILWNTVQF